MYSKDYQFAKQFLGKLYEGMKLDKPQTSRSEFEVLIRTFNECLLYLLVHMNGAKHVHSLFIKHIMHMVGYAVHAQYMCKLTCACTYMYVHV